ncbi:hypothetical protein DFP72DRAFT_27479 [Ephemerocybe angulata]|uniref:Hemimethylated DNA-binding domain-containing protein n=1 Tax=Ephemerocybe angulata TaxID=980116 RepID=A0A8H6IL52_9AGAR|nr:hypothetical protein DFP72DRAFT_27479 [Tulosesus angulatus]
MGPLPQLPLDVLVCILSHLPPDRTRGDLSARTIARFSICSRLFNEATSVSSIWEAHYEERFTVVDVSKEEERRGRLGDDWGLLYAERKRLEKKALDVVLRMSTERKTRRRSVKDIADLSLDVWDVLHLEHLAPFPPSFGTASTWNPDDGKVPDRPLSWRYWSDRALQTCTRAHAIRELHGLKEAEGTPNELPFSDAMNLLSCFYAVAPVSVAEHLAELEDCCDEYIEEMGHTTDPNSPEYDKVQLVEDIVTCLWNQGYGCADSQRYRDLMKIFPHAYLSGDLELRRTLPLSLAHIFVHVARHYELDAAPTNTPDVVLARVESEEHPTHNFILVNPVRFGTDGCVVPPPYPDRMQRYLQPTGAIPMLLRTARNIVASLQGTPASDSASQSAFMCAIVIEIFLEASDEDALLLLGNINTLPALEVYTFSAVAAPLLNERRRHFLGNFCRKALEKEEREAFTMSSKARTDENVKYFVGMVFRHRRMEYYACIIGWDENYRGISEDSDVMSDICFPRSRQNQPHYYAFTCDEGYTRYVAQDDIQIIPLTAELASSFVWNTFPEICRFVCDVQLSTESNERGLFRPSIEMKQEYPEDEWYGSRWIKEGREAVSEQIAAVEAFTQQFKDLL